MAGPDLIKFYDFICILFEKIKITKNKESILIDDAMPIPHAGEIKKLNSIVAKNDLTKFKTGINNIKI